MEQFNSGESSFIFGIIPHKYSIGRMIVGKFACSRRRIKKKISSTSLIFQEQLFTSRALQGHSGRSLIDPLLQDNVIIQRGFIPTYLPFRMCI